MSQEAKTPADKKQIRFDKLDSVPVALLKFRVNEAYELPGLKGLSTLTAMPMGAVFDSETGERKYAPACHVVDFIPAIRHHRVRYYGDQNAPVEERLVPEGQVRSWAPL